jgi:hypothetical protein
MATAAVTYTFTNGTNADALQVNQNFSDILAFINASVVQTDGSTALASNAVTEAKIANGAVTSAKIADGTIVNADINASAAIALSKLATGALPAGITVASANITDNTIVDADISTSASIQARKILAAGIRYKLASAQSILNNTNTILSIDTSVFTQGTSAQLISGGGGFVLSQQGIWLLTAGATFAANATGNRRIRIVDTNAGTIFAESSISGFATNDNVLNCTAIIQCTSSPQYIEVQVFQTSGSALNVKSDTTTFFSAVLLGG